MVNIYISDHFYPIYLKTRAPIYRRNERLPAFSTVYELQLARDTVVREATRDRDLISFQITFLTKIFKL